MSDGEVHLPGERRRERGRRDIPELLSDSESEPEDPEGPPLGAFGAIFRMAVGPRGGGWPLHRHRAPLASNAALVEHLVAVDALHDPGVREALQLCPRDRFVPGGAAQHPDVFADAPVHVSGQALGCEAGFNVSAPHMHCACLQALDLRPGHRVLDVGSGSGLLSACMALLVGPRGSVLGIDCLPAATALARRNLRSHARRCPEFAARAAACAFATHNVFLPAANFQGRFDRIVVGASCPPERLDWLLSLLRPEGGLLVTPVHPADLRAVTKLRGGGSTQRVLSQVRFSNLELPQEASVLRAQLQQERAAACQPPAPRSTFVADLARIAGARPPAPADQAGSRSAAAATPLLSAACASVPSSAARPPTPHDCDSGSGGTPRAGSSPRSEATQPRRSLLGGGPPPASWPRRSASKPFAACSGSEGSASGDDACMAGPDSPCKGEGAPSLDAASLGPHDCAFLGAGWSLPAHKAVLRHRSELLRARCASGMRDAEAGEVAVPDGFSQAAVASFLRYCYTDRLEGCEGPEAAAACLAVSLYLGAPHLAALCERALAAELAAADEGAAALAPGLLALADESGLPHLQAVATDFIVQNYPAVAATPGFAALTKQQMDLVSARACAQLRHLHSLLDGLDGGHKAAFCALP